MARAQKNRGILRRTVRTVGRLALIVVIIAVMVLAALIVLYRSPSIHPVSTLMLRDLALGSDYERTWVDFEDISPALVQSVLMSEDGQYCFHQGVDWDALDLVIDDALEGERTRGASTIAMQTVKNVYLWGSRSYVRKALEIPLAMIVDYAWSKQRTLEIYLNVAEWGPGSTESRRRPSTISVFRRRGCHGGAPPTWPLPCPIRCDAIQPSRHAACRGWLRWSSDGPACRAHISNALMISGQQFVGHPPKTWLSMATDPAECCSD